MIRFNFDEAKAVEAVVLIAQRRPGITPFFLAKVLFFADRNHLRAYGRPVTGDTYIAMDAGPVPSRVYDMVKDDLDLFGNPDAIVQGIQINRNHRYPAITAKRAPDLDLLSETDIAAIEQAIEYCKDKSFTELSSITHQEPAWLAAPADGAMDPELLVPDELREEVREAAAYAVL